MRPWVRKVALYANHKQSFLDDPDDDLSAQRKIKKMLMRYTNNCHEFDYKLQRNTQNFSIEQYKSDLKECFDQHRKH